MNRLEQLASVRATMMTVALSEHDGLAHWASYFVNGDASGLAGEEVIEADQWLKDNDLDTGDCVDVKDERVGRFDGYLAEIATYVFRDRRRA